MNFGKNGFAGLRVWFFSLLVDQLTVLQGMVDASELSFGAMTQTADQAAAAWLPPLQAASGTDEPLIGERLESRQLMAACRSRLVTDEPVQRAHVAALRSGAFRCWGDRPSFRALAQWLDDDASQAALLALCEQRLTEPAVQEVVDGAWSDLGLAWLADVARRDRNLNALQRRAVTGLASVTDLTEALPPARIGWWLPSHLAEGLCPSPEPTLEEAPAQAAPLTQRLREIWPVAADTLAIGEQPVLAVLKVQSVASPLSWRRVQELATLHQAWRRRHGSAARGLQLEAWRADADTSPDPEQVQAVLLLADALGLLEETPAATLVQPEGLRLTHVRRDADGFEFERHALGCGLIDAANRHGADVLGALYDDVLDRILASAADAGTADRIRQAMQRRIDALCSSSWPAEQRDERSRAWHVAARTAMKILRQDTHT